MRRDGPRFPQMGLKSRGSQLTGIYGGLPRAPKANPRQGMPELGDMLSGESLRFTVHRGPRADENPNAEEEFRSKPK